ncbi:EAL domain-containing protein [Legionella sp. PATHC035]|uniref:EAL domain-containing protein n=1 Tax=Legionella sp. PATHC035 TaxID=2992040 RepID=UPI002243B2FF|nr:EAL domain-containing protein [Legionella sp. PATHC035]MCW8409818.1 EAL domain-containing protein [Legionella sp. PATHC035]
MKSSLFKQEMSSQLEKIAAERDELISKIKEYEKLLKGAPELILQYIEMIATPFYQFSIDLEKISYINPAAEKLFGRSRQELYQNSSLWFQSIHEDDRANVIQALRDTVNGKESDKLFEYRVIMPDGTMTYVADRPTLIYDKQGDKNCIMGFITNLSGLFNAKRELLLYDQILNVAHHEKSVEVAVEAILKISCLSFAWDEGEVWLIDQSTSSLYCIKIWHSLHDEIREFYEKSYQLKIDIQEGLQGEVIRDNLPILVTDYGEHEQYIRGDLAVKAGLNCAFGLPLAYQGQTLGVLLYFSKKVKKLTHDQILALEKVSHVLGSLIQNKFNKDQMIHLIHHEKLTGLVNRSGLEEFLQTEINKYRKSLIALIMVDFDRFKKINESMGFDVGDAVLKNIAVKFNEYLSDSCSIIANIGGDQFVFAVSNMKQPEDISPLVERIRSIVKTPLIIDHQTILLTISMGISIYPYDGTDFLSLLQNADIALNQAKVSGGNSVEYFSAKLQKAVTHSIEIETKLRKSLTENDFRLYYQPKVDLKSGNIVGVEALLRWQNPDNGLILPGAFLPLAEQSDLIVYIGEWVLLEVCRNFPFEHLHIPVSINFSARQFLIEYDIVKFVELLLEKLSLDPALLEIELTETQLLNDLKHTTNVLESLRKMGLSFAIDDFGIGYSSFQYLKQFKPNKIKIDKFFIDGLPQDLENAGIVKSIIALCKSLNIKVVAEGVENAQQLQFLLDEGCDEMQGFYFSPPVPIYDIINLIDSKKNLNSMAPKASPRKKA